MFIQIFGLGLLGLAFAVATNQFLRRPDRRNQWIGIAMLVVSIGAGLVFMGELAKSFANLLPYGDIVGVLVGCFMFGLGGRVARLIPDRFGGVHNR